MKSGEADATIAHLCDRSPGIRVEDHVTYFRLESEAGISIDLGEVSSYLGREVSMPSFLVTVSAYFGEISIAETLLTITPLHHDGVRHVDGDGSRPDR